MYHSVVFHLPPDFPTLLSLLHSETRKQRKKACRQASTNTRHNVSLPLSLLWQHQWTTGRRWQLHKMDEPEAKGCIPLDVLRKHFDSASLSSHKTLWQLIQSFYHTPTNPNDTNETTPSDVSIQDVPSGCQARVRTHRCPKPRPWWHRGLERAQRGSGDVMGLGLLIDEWTWMRAGQCWPFEDSSSQNKFINRPYFRNPAYGKHTDRKGYWAHSTVTPDFPRVRKRPQLELWSASHDHNFLTQWPITFCQLSSFKFRLALEIG